MKRTCYAWVAYLGVLLVALLLTWIALGHTGTISSGRSIIRLAPFSEYREPVACIMSSCDALRTAQLFLLVNGLGNVVVFMPLGAMVYAALRLHFANWSSLWIATIVGMSIGLLYEIAQLWIPGRVTATDDVILNAAGSALGAWAVSGFTHWIHTYRAAAGEGLDGR